MLNIPTREQQLAKLRADRQRDLASERVIVDFAVDSGILPVGADRLFDRHGQYPGWHGIIDDLVRNLAADKHSTLKRFVVVGNALAVTDTALLMREFELILDASDQTSVTCCVCGERRGSQPLSVTRMTCDVCTAVDLLMGTDPEADEARGWHSTI